MSHPRPDNELGTIPDAQLRAAAEAILIVADEPVSEALLAQALDITQAQATDLCEYLAHDYASSPEGGRGFILRRGAEGWRFASAPRFSYLVEQFVIGGATARLSSAALETLAVIAYRQPVTRARVSAIRGVNVDGVVRTLYARGLIDEAGTEPSGAIRYRTTAAFLDYLGIESLDELPPLAPYLPDPSLLSQLDDEAAERIL